MSIILAMPFVLFQFSVRPFGAAVIAPAPSTPANAYVLEDGATFYVAEDNTTFYVQES